MTACLVPLAVVFTACVGESAEEGNQRRIDAMSTVTKSMYTIVGAELPDQLAFTEPCFSTFGNETDELAARFVSNDVPLGGPADQTLLDQVLAGFGEPTERSDRLGTLNTGEEARIVDFGLTIDGMDVVVTTRVTTGGKFGWSARIGC